METSAPTMDLDISDYSANSDPYSTYAKLLEQFPVCRFRSGNYVLSRYADVKAALRNWPVFGEGASPEARGEWWLPEDCQREVFLITKHPPEHEKLRSLVNKNYVRAAISAYTPAIAAKTRHLVTGALQSQSPIDIVETFAYPLASTASSLATGISDNPYHAQTIRRWSYLSELSTPNSPESHRTEVIQETRKLNRIYEELIGERTRNPKTDLVSLLLDATVDEKHLSFDTICGALALFLSAGFMTTAQSLSSAFRELALRPELKQQLITTPDLIPAFIEELLRFCGPTHSVLRLTKAPVTLEHTTIPEGSLVHLLLGAANRDPRQFSHPNDFVLERPNIKSHVAFGHGIHICIGAALVRLVLRTVLSEILKSFSSHQMIIVSERWSSTLYTRGLDELRITFEKNSS